MARVQVPVQVKGGWKTQQSNPMTLLLGNTSFVVSVITLKGDSNSLSA